MFFASDGRLFNVHGGGLVKKPSKFLGLQCQCVQRDFSRQGKYVFLYDIFFLTFTAVVPFLFPQVSFGPLQGVGRLTLYAQINGYNLVIICVKCQIPTASFFLVCTLESPYNTHACPLFQTTNPL